MTNEELSLAILSSICLRNKNLRLIAGFILVDTLLHIGIKPTMVFFDIWKKEFYDVFLLIHVSLAIVLVSSLWLFNFFVSKFAGAVLATSYLLFIAIDVISAILVLNGHLYIAMDYRPVFAQLAMLLQVFALFAELIDYDRGISNRTRTDRDIAFYRHYQLNNK